MCISKVDRVAEFSRLHDEGLVRTSLGFLSSSAKPLLNKVVNIVEFPVMEIHTTYLALLITNNTQEENFQGLLLNKWSFKRWVEKIHMYCM